MRKSLKIKENKSCYKNIATCKVVELTAFDEGIPAEEVVRNQPLPTDSSKKISHGR